MVDKLETKEILEDLITFRDNVYNHSLGSLQQWIIVFGNRAEKASQLMER